jgi:ribonuclease-3
VPGSANLPRAGLPRRLLGSGRVGRPPARDQQLAEQALADALGHRFADGELFALALTHPSWRNEHSGVSADNQRLEFLGDLVLGLAIGDLLLVWLPEAREGQLSALKAQLVREATLAAAAERIGVGPALRLGRGEARGGGRERPSVLADALEALLGAVYADAGFEAARALVGRVLGDDLRRLLAEVGGALEDSLELHASTRNFKNALQEWLARRGGEPPRYRCSERADADEVPADERFVCLVQAEVEGHPTFAEGRGASGKAAEVAAAEALFRALTER